MSGGSKHVRGFTLVAPNLNNPEMIVVGAPPPPYSITWLPFFGATSHKPRVRVRGLSRSVVDPGGGIREDQFCLVLRGGGFFNPGIVPPRDAKRRALSPSMRALRASRIKAVFSATPEYCWARRTRS